MNMLNILRMLVVRVLLTVQFYRLMSVHVLDLQRFFAVIPIFTSIIICIISR